MSDINDPIAPSTTVEDENSPLPQPDSTQIDPAPNNIIKKVKKRSAPRQKLPIPPKKRGRPKKKVDSDGGYDVNKLQVCSFSQGQTYYMHIKDLLNIATNINIAELQKENQSEITVATILTECNGALDVITVRLSKRKVITTTKEQYSKAVNEYYGPSGIKFSFSEPVQLQAVQPSEVEPLSSFSDSDDPGYDHSYDLDSSSDNENPSIRRNKIKTLNRQYSTRQSNRNVAFDQKKIDHIKSILLTKSEMRRTKYHLWFQPKDASAPLCEFLMASDHVASQFARAAGLDESKIFSPISKMHFGDYSLKFLENTSPLSPMQMKPSFAWTAHKPRSNKSSAKQAELQFHGEHCAWLHPVTFLESYPCLLPDAQDLKNEFIQQIPQLEKTNFEMLHDPLSLFIVCLPFEFVFDLYAYTNTKHRKGKKYPKISLKHLIFYFLYLLGGFAQLDGEKSELLVPTMCNAISRSILLNQFDQSNDEGAMHESSAFNLANRVTESFSKHVSNLFTGFSTIFVGEVAPFHWTGTPKRTLICPGLVQNFPFEFKCINEVQAGLRLAMITVPAAPYYDVKDQTMPTFLQVMKLLQLSGMLTDYRRKPSLIITDKAFSSMYLAAHLRSRYSIHFLGPIGRNPLDSLFSLTKTLQLADQESFVVCSQIKDPFIDPKDPTDDDEYVPELLKPASHPFRFNFQSKNSPSNPFARRPTPVPVYQAIDGGQHLIFTQPYISMHHHCSPKALKNYSKLSAAQQHDSDIGFHCLTPRFVYCVHYNCCQLFNKDIATTWYPDTEPTKFSTQLVKLVIDSSVVNALKIFRHLSGEQLTLFEYAVLIMESACAYYNKDDLL